VKAGSLASEAPRVRHQSAKPVRAGTHGAQPILSARGVASDFQCREAWPDYAAVGRTAIRYGPRPRFDAVTAHPPSRARPDMPHLRRFGGFFATAVPVLTDFADRCRTFGAPDATPNFEMRSRRELNMNDSFIHIV